MSKKVLIKSSALLFVFLSFGILYNGYSLASYQTATEFYGFPVPKDARLVRETDLSKGFEWKKASFDSGIPISYKKAINHYGWKKVFQEGGITVYTKDKKRISLLTDTDYLEILMDT
ncbi:hypothetical protein [Bacillus sp. 1P06AnD]|uniref:hypothetical protein n=1 Tax=Bacillus sp. 1P06AnD TaxID=3132208 RepID=UPI0039A225DB